MIDPNHFRSQQWKDKYDKAEENPKIKANQIEVAKSNNNSKKAKEKMKKIMVKANPKKLFKSKL